MGWFNTKLSDELHAYLKIRATKENKNLEDLIPELLEIEMKREKDSEARKIVDMIAGKTNG